MTGSIMMTNEDMRYLADTAGKRGAVKQATLLCTIVFLVVAANVKLYLAGLWASACGYSFQKFLAIYVTGVSATRAYPGSLILAADDLGFGLLLLGIGLVLSAAWWRGRKDRGSMQRVISSLKSAGLW
jgi:hypothetical protein